MTDTEPSLTYPGLFVAADELARESQSRYHFWFVAQSALVLSAAIAGLGTWHVGVENDVDAAGIVAVLFFLAALLVEYAIGVSQFQKEWYGARAAAESIKTMTWTFAVCGAAFPKSMSDAEARQEFGRRMREVIRDISYDGPAITSLGPNITDSMEVSREAGLAVRKDLYASERITDQQGWYTRSAKANKRTAARWRLVLAGSYLVGVALGIAKIVGTLEHDWLGVVAAFCGLLVAWTKVKQYDSNAAAYSVASRELSVIHDDLHGANTEEQWASFVQDAEEAVSREHTTWRASKIVSG